MKRQSGRIFRNFRRLMVSGLALCGLLFFFSSSDAAQFPLYIVDSNGYNIPGDAATTNLPGGNTTTKTNTTYLSLLSTSAPANGTTQIKSTWTPRRNWYSMARIYYNNPSTSNLTLSANATGTFYLRSTNTLDQYRFTLRDYNPAAGSGANGTFIAQQTYNSPSTTASTSQAVAFGNAQYTLPAGHYLEVEIEYWPRDTSNTGYVYCNSSSRSRINVELRASIVSSAGANGSISGPATTPGTATFDVFPLQSTTYTITANTLGGYQIESLLVDGSPVAAAVGQATWDYTFSNITAGHTISASFVSTVSTLIITTGSGGTTSLPAFSMTWPGGTTSTYTVGGSGTFNFVIIPDPGYGIDAVFLNGVDQAVPQGQVTPLSIPVAYAAGASTTLASSFKRFYTVTTSVTGTGTGSISPSGATAVLSGGSLNIDVITGGDSKLVSITDNGVNVGNTSPYSITNITANHDVVATFAPVYHITSIAGPNGTISPIGDVAVDAGTSRNFSFSPDVGFRVNDVLIDGTSIGAVSNYTFTNVAADHTIEVVFIDAPVPSTYCAVPAFITTPAPPNVMLMLSVESPMEGAANPTVTCTGTPSAINYTCSSSGLGTYDNARNYYGYFESNKCYTYSGSGATGLFTPSGAATNHQCAAGTAWSGNMLNWSTMLAVDAFRKAFTGGNRTVDTTTNTVLLGAVNDGSWFPVNPTITNAERYMPITGTNQTRTIMRQGAGIGFVLCPSGQTSCNVSRTGSGEAQWPTSSTSGASVYSLRIKACDPTGGVESRCNTTTNKPEGTIQKYMDKMRFSLIAYASDNNQNRDGGVLREKMKWVGPKIVNGLKFHDASNTVVTCTTNAGCDNPEKEVNTDGTFVNNPDGASSGNSGLVNYINKFAYTSGYKSYDPVSEMYYQAVRYFRNQTPSGSNYCNGLSEPNDNFPVYCNASKTNARGWRDPALYPCSQNFVIAVNDANPWLDKRIPGTSFNASAGSNTGVGDWCGSSQGGCDSDFRDGGVQINVETWTKNVGDIEGLTGKNIGMDGCQVTAAGACASPMGTAYTISNLGRVIQTGRDNSYLVSGLAYYAHMSDLRPDLAGSQNLTTYMIDTQEPGGSMSVGPKNMLQLAAKFGGFDDKDSDGRPYMNASCGGVSASPNTLCSEWDTDNDGVPDNYFFASDSGRVESSLYRAFASILNRATSGTAAAVANNRSGERGANIIQALFYPQWPNDMGVKWLGDVQALWFYLDPIVKFSGIFEDSDLDRELNLAVDRPPGTDATTVHALWKAGPELHARTASARSIYTLLSTTEMDLTNAANSFDTTHTATLKPLMDISSLTNSAADALINYVRGVDSGTYRSRTVLNQENSVTGVWKLGDVINSTPQIQGGDSINNYHLDYGDQSYNKYSQSSNYKSKNYVYAGSNDGMLHAFRLGQVRRINDPDNVYRIATIIDETDLGKEEWAYIPQNVRPYLKNCADSNYCHQYMVDGTPLLLDASINRYSGCSSNYWDCLRKTTYSGVTTNLDAAQTSWKSIIIGSMGLGGANRDGNCNETLSPDADATNNTDCIRTPVAGSGYSSYFALDITNPLVPVHMWEFSDGALPVADRGLGLTTPGPAVVRINTLAGSPPKPVKTTNGRWFAVFASGPTGKIDTGTKQFLGRSDQNLKLYVVDIGSGGTFTKCTTAGQTGCNYWVINTGIKFAFANSLINSTLDADKRDAYSDGFYSDDVVYITYNKASLDTSASPGPYPTAWDKGGVLRLMTNNDPDPINWFTSSLIDDIGPITRSVDIVQNRVSRKVWVFFGEGRYFYNGDDSTASRRIYGVADPCYSHDLNHVNMYSTTAANCPSVAIGDLKDQSNTPNDVLSSTDRGWYITLDPASGVNGAERMIGGVSANPNGVVFFTTFIPSTNLCEAGGVPSQWAVNYNTGGVPPARAMQGKVIMTTSDQPIAKPVNIGGAFTQRGGRKLDASISNNLRGVPPPQPPPTVTLPPPVKRIMNIMER